MNDELARLYGEDQADRAEQQNKADWPAISTRDIVRRQRVETLLAAGAVQTPEDCFHAAMILQHGEELAHYWQAHELAKRAAAGGHATARWLAAAAYDRWLLHQQQPQKYGTHYIVDGIRWRLWDVDPATTDAERAEWNVSPLEQAHQHAGDMMAAEPPTMSPTTIELPGLRVDIITLSTQPALPVPQPLPPDTPAEDLPTLPTGFVAYKVEHAYGACSADGQLVLFWSRINLAENESIAIGWVAIDQSEPTLESVDVAGHTALLISGQPQQLASLVVRINAAACWFVSGYVPSQKLFDVAASLLSARTRGDA